MKRIFYQIVQITEPDISIAERVNNLLSVLAKITPVVYILNLANWWFSENEQFGTFVCIALVMNMVVGMVVHLKNKTFNFVDFLGKNVIMVFVICSVYVMLEMLRYTAGDNIVGEIFRVLIQVTTLMYPTSKIFKNSYILTDGKYPPDFIMTRLYNFEKNGDLNEFFRTKKKDDEE